MYRPIYRNIRFLNHQIFVSVSALKILYRSGSSRNFLMSLSICSVTASNFCPSTFCTLVHFKIMKFFWLSEVLVELPIHHFIYMLYIINAFFPQTRRLNTETRQNHVWNQSETTHTRTYTHTLPFMSSSVCGASNSSITCTSAEGTSSSVRTSNRWVFIFLLVSLILFLFDSFSQTSSSSSSLCSSSSSSSLCSFLFSSLLISLPLFIFIFVTSVSCKFKLGFDVNIKKMKKWK